MWKTIPDIGYLLFIELSILGVRDYIHVVDLAKAHVFTINKMKGEHGCKVSSSYIYLITLS